MNPDANHIADKPPQRNIVPDSSAELVSRRRFLKQQGGISAAVLIGWNAPFTSASGEEEEVDPSIRYRLKLESVSPEQDVWGSREEDAADNGNIKLEVYVNADNVTAPPNAPSVAYAYRAGVRVLAKNVNGFFEIVAQREYTFSAEAHLVDGGPEVDSSVTRDTTEDPEGMPSPNEITVEIEEVNYNINLDIDASGDGGSNSCFARASLYSGPVPPEGEFDGLVVEVPLPTPGTGTQFMNYVGVVHVFASEPIEDD